jgi:anti-sigma factor RsiW
MPLLELELDGELDARSSLELREHVERCAACERQSASLRALSEAAREHLPRYEMPPELERRILRSVRPRPRRALLSASAVTVLGAAAVLALWPQKPVSDALLSEAVTAHARSLQLSHALDVPTSDQHTVKPWFEGKVGFAVPVRDYAADGFVLAGGRLDVLEGRPAAAVVYRHAQHVVNLFVTDGAAKDKPLTHSTLRGFGCWQWSAGGLTYLLVSDVTGPEMDALAQKMASSP